MGFVVDRTDDSSVANVVVVIYLLDEHCLHIGVLSRLDRQFSARNHDFSRGHSSAFLTSYFAIYYCVVEIVIYIHFVSCEFFLLF